MSVEAFLLAGMLATSAGQAVFALIAVKNGWYSPVARVLVCALALLSSAGGLWFVGAGLTGGETLPPALLFVCGQACALWTIVYCRVKELVGR